MACRTPGILSMVHPGLLKLCTSWLECRVLQLCTSWLECRGLQLCTWWLEGSQGIQVFDHISKCASGIPRLPPEGVKLNNRGLGHAKHSGACPDPRCGALMNSSPGGVELSRSAPTGSGMGLLPVVQPLPGLGMDVVCAIHGFHPWLLMLRHFVA